MTRDRIDQIIRSTPMGGNYSSRMTADEIAEVNAAWDLDPSGDSSFASTLRRMARLPAWPAYAED